MRGWAGEGIVFCVSGSTPESARAALIPSGCLKTVVRCLVSGRAPTPAAAILTALVR